MYKKIVNNKVLKEGDVLTCSLSKLYAYVFDEEDNFILVSFRVSDGSIIKRFDV